MYKTVTSVISADSFVKATDRFRFNSDGAFAEFQENYFDHSEDS